MKTLICLLRGINVSGQKKILMKDLKLSFDKWRFKNVRTYIQSGNIVFNSEMASKHTADIIKKGIMSDFGFDVSVLVLTPDELKNAIDNNPYSLSSHDPKFLGLTFLQSPSKPEHIKALEAIPQTQDSFIIKDKVVYLYVPYGFGKTKFTNQFFEKKLATPATSRNWKTVNTLYEMALTYQK